MVSSPQKIQIEVEKEYYTSKEPRNLHRGFLKHFKRQKSRTRNSQIQYALIDKLLEHEFTKLEAIIAPSYKTPKYVMDCAQGKVEKILPAGIIVLFPYK